MSAAAAAEGRPKAVPPGRGVVEELAAAAQDGGVSGPAGPPDEGMEPRMTRLSWLTG